MGIGPWFSRSLTGLGVLWPPSTLLIWGPRAWGQRPIGSCAVTSLSSLGSHPSPSTTITLPSAQLPFGGG